MKAIKPFLINDIGRFHAPCCRPDRVWKAGYPGRGTVANAYSIPLLRDAGCACTAGEEICYRNLRLEGLTGFEKITAVLSIVAALQISSSGRADSASTRTRMGPYLPTDLPRGGF